MLQPYHQHGTIMLRMNKWGQTGLSMIYISTTYQKQLPGVMSSQGVCWVHGQEGLSPGRGIQERPRSLPCREQWQGVVRCRPLLSGHPALTMGSSEMSWHLPSRKNHLIMIAQQAQQQ